jgi:hypothetical protein
VTANNVFAQFLHVKRLSQRVHTLLKPDGVLTLEFPHLLRLMMETAIRYDLSRALLVFFRARGSARAGRAWLECSTSKKFQRMAVRFACMPLRALATRAGLPPRGPETAHRA